MRTSGSVGAFLCLLLSGCNWWEESDYANCAVADSAAAFVGRHLAHDGNAKVQVMLITSCMEEDRRTDGGDGSHSGRVRWVVCYKGPDCDEAGMQ